MNIILIIMKLYIIFDNFFVTYIEQKVKRLPTSSQIYISNTFE